jgi:exodeoxyribonuclease VII large subunit
MRRLQHPAEKLRGSRQLVAQLASRLASAIAHQMELTRYRLRELRSGLAAFDPTAVLARGYSITRAADGTVVTDASSVREGQELKTMLAKGWVESEVKRKG